MNISFPIKIVMLDYASLGKDLPLEPLSKYGPNLVVWDDTTPEQAPERIKNAEVLLINKFRITSEVLDCAPNLKLICIFATGYDNIDLAAARAHGVAVCNVPAYSTDSVALITISTALSLATHLPEYSDFVKSGAYSASGLSNCISPVFHELTRKTWGIIGCGNIGRKVAEIAGALGMKVLTYQRRPSERYETVDLDTLCRESDILSIHCPLTSATRGMINADKLSLMKPSAILINEARGAVVVEEHVARAIETGTIAAYGCDVFTQEPFGPGHPYYRIKAYPNVILTPHCAWGAFESRVRCLEIICGNIDSFLAGGKQNRVDMEGNT